MTLSTAASPSTQRAAHARRLVAIDQLLGAHPDIVSCCIGYEHSIISASSSPTR